MRSTWKGSIRFKFVTVPVKLYPATTEANRLSGHMIHKACGGRLQQRMVCPTCNVHPAKDEIVKGYEYTKGTYAVFDDAELDAIQVPSSHELNIVAVVEDQIDPLYVEKIDYLVPDTKVAALDTYAIVREALRDKLAIAKLCVRGREALVAIQPHENALRLLTLRSAEEVRETQLFEEFRAETVVDAEMVNMARQMFALAPNTVDVTQVRDAYQDRLREVIAAKMTGGAVPAVAVEPAPSVSSLMDALKQSLAMAKADLAAPAPTAVPVKVSSKKSKPTKKAKAA